MFSDQSAQIQEILIGGFVIFMMLSVGLDLTIEKIKAVFKEPRILFAALAINYLLIPIVFIGLIKLSGLDGMWATGLLFVAVAPGGPVAGVLVQNARGHLALGVSILIVMNLLNTVLTPIGVWLVDALPASGGSGPPLFGMVQTIVFYQILPLALAMQFRRKWEDKANWLQPFMEQAAKWLLISVAVILCVIERNRLALLPFTLLVIIHVAVAISLAVGWWLTPGSRGDKIAISLTAPYRSMSIVMLLLSAWVRDVDALLAAMAYSVGMLWMCIVTSMIIRRRQTLQP